MPTEFYYENAELAFKVNKISALQKKGVLVFGSSINTFGLPIMDRIPELSYRGGRYVCPQGYLDYDYTLGQYIFTPNDGKNPENMPINPLICVSAHINQEQGRATVNHDGNTVTLDEVFVLDSPGTICNAVTAELAILKMPYVVTALTRDNEQESKRLWEGRNTRLITSQAVTSMTGYAISEEDDRLIYAGVVGYKTLLESIRATFQQGQKTTKKIQVNIGNRGYLLAKRQYVCLYAPLAGVMQHHMRAVSQSAIPGRWAHGDLTGHLLEIEGIDYPIEYQLIHRLNEATSVPLLKEWAKKLWHFVSENLNLIRPMKVGGDCVRGYTVTLNEDLWAEYIQTLLKDSHLTI